MELGTITFAHLSASGAIAAAPFTIKEEADGIAQRNTDRGNIVCEMVRRQGKWRCLRMTINYESIPQGRAFAPVQVAMVLGYNDHDYRKLVTFLELPNGTGKNGHQINPDYKPEDPTT